MLREFKFLKIFLDDVLIFSPRKTTHLDHLTKVRENFKKEGVSINYEKSHFVKEEVTYLGCIVNK
jgi:hypothetical protein